MGETMTLGGRNDPTRTMTFEAWVKDPLTRRIAAGAGIRIPPITDVALTPALPAFLNHGRWVAWCSECPGQAEHLWATRPQIVCFRCGNASVGGKWRPVRLPDNWQAIEAGVEGLPVAAQNYEPEDLAIPVVSVRAALTDPEAEPNPAYQKILREMEAAIAQNRAAGLIDTEDAG